MKDINYEEFNKIIKASHNMNYDKLIELHTELTKTD